MLKVERKRREREGRFAEMHGERAEVEEGFAQLVASSSALLRLSIVLKYQLWSVC